MNQNAKQEPPIPCAGCGAVPKLKRGEYLYGSMSHRRDCPLRVGRRGYSPKPTPSSTPADAPTGKIVVERYIVEESGEMRIEPGSAPTDATGEAGGGPTPETDAQAGFILDSNEEYPQGFQLCSTGSYVPADFARKLERAIATLRAERDAARAEVDRVFNGAKSNLDALRAECEGLRADKVRLDWLEAQSVLSLDWITPDGFSCGMNIDPNERLGAAPDLRTALDAASSATEGQG